MRNKCLLIIISFLLGSSVLSADEPANVLLLSLRDALTLARQRHAEIIMADERVEAALARLGQSAAGILPHFSGFVAGSRQTRDLRGQGIALPGDPHVGPFNAFDARVKMTQAIFDPGAVARLNAASKGKELSFAERTKVEEDVLALVATLYLNASQAVEELKARRVTLQSDEHALKTLVTRFREGTASAIELDSARNRYEESHLKWAQAESEEVRTRLDLCAALDLPMDGKIEFVSQDLAVDWDQEEFLSLEDHPDIVKAQQDLDWKIAQRGAERSEWLPRVSALADYGKSGQSPDESSRTYSVGLQATIPIWEGGLRENLIKEATSRVNESQLRLEDAQRQTRARVLTAFETIKEAQAFIRLANAQMQAADRQAKLAANKLGTGQGSRQDVLDSLAVQASARADEARALAAYQSAQVNLAHALGRMEELLETQRP